jgi:peptidoglycan/LPS O-acetylase OafA/YrhL
MTIADRLLQADGRPAGFDYLRISLALAVVGIHVPQVVSGMAIAYPFWMPWLRPIHAIVIPLFFALSGFLVAGSLLRSKTLITFFGLRILRIAPALSVEVLLSALILGPLFTNKPLTEYFTGRLFFRYFYNLVGHVQYSLPGVFADNPFPDMVNEQLWTIPPELKCYILVGLLSLCLVFRHRLVLLAVAIGFNLAIFALYGMAPGDGHINVGPSVIIGCFLAGVVSFVFRDKIPARASFFMVAMVASIAMLLIPHGEYFLPAPIAYSVAYLGTFNPNRSRLLFSGDYSYGIYLYGFPLQQAVVATGGAHGNWFLNVIVALPFIITIAAFSWWVVERPSLALRKHLSLIEAMIMRPRQLINYRSR